MPVQGCSQCSKLHNARTNGGCIDTLSLDLQGHVSGLAVCMLSMNAGETPHWLLTGHGAIAAKRLQSFRLQQSQTVVCIKHCVSEYLE